MRITFLIFTLLFFCVGIPQTHAKGKIRAIEAQNFVILYSQTGKTTNIKDPLGKKQKMVELGYKLVNRAESPRALFGNSGWAAVRFQDTEGYDLFEDSVNMNAFDHNRSYYGFVWAEKRRLNKVARINVTPILARRLAEIQEQQDRWGEPLESQLQEERKIHREKMEKEIRKPVFWKRLNPLRVFKKKEKPIESYFAEDSTENTVEEVKEAPRPTKPIPEPEMVEIENPEDEATAEMEQVLEELEAINYEDTDATFEIEPSEDVITEQDVAIANAEHDATDGMDTTAVLVGAETNEDVTALLEALKDIPATPTGKEQEPS